jgi:hypothetical protein
MLAKVWQRFGVRLRQSFPKLRYIKVLDTGTGGNCHYHVLCDTYIDRDWLLRTWTACGGGYIVDIRLVPSKAAAGYVSKYISSLKAIREDVEKAIYEASLRRFSASKDALPKYDRRVCNLLARCYDMDTLINFLTDQYLPALGLDGLIPLASVFYNETYRPPKLADVAGPA